MYVCIDVYGFLDNNDSTCFFVYSIMPFLILYTFYIFNIITHKVPPNQIKIPRKSFTNHNFILLKVHMPIYLQYHYELYS